MVEPLSLNFKVFTVKYAGVRNFKVLLFSSSLLVEEFVQQFPGRSLPVELAEFSFPTQLRESQNILQQKEKQVNILY